jgi:protein subunit release factor A
MEAESESPSIAAAHERQVPEAMLQKLHEATERFHQAKKSLDAANAASEFNHQHSIDKAAEEFRTAEREVEEITLQIHGSLKPPPLVTPGH